MSESTVVARVRAFIIVPAAAEAVEITNIADSTIIVPSANATQYIAGTNTTTLTALWWTNSLGGDILDPGVGNWQFDAPLQAGINFVVVRGTNAAGDIASDSLTIIRLVPPYVDISNDNFTAYFETVAIDGTNGAGIVGDMTVVSTTGATTNYTASVPATTPWSVTVGNLVLYATNFVTITVTNAMGESASDTIEIYRVEPPEVTIVQTPLDVSAGGTGSEIPTNGILIAANHFGREEPVPVGDISYIPWSVMVTNWDFTGSQNPGWSASRNYALSPDGIVLGMPGVGEGMMRIAAPAGLSFTNSGLEMVYNGGSAASTGEGIQYMSLDNINWRCCYGLGAQDLTTGPGWLNQNYGLAGGENLSRSNITSVTGASFVGIHTQALVRLADNTLIAYLDGVEIGSRATDDAANHPLVSIGVGDNNFGGSTYMSESTVVARVTAFVIGSSPEDPMLATDPVTLDNGLTFGTNTWHMTSGWYPMHSTSNDVHGHVTAVTNPNFGTLMRSYFWMTDPSSVSHLDIPGLTPGGVYRLQLISTDPEDCTVTIEGCTNVTWSGSVPSVLSFTWSAIDTEANVVIARTGGEIDFTGYVLQQVVVPEPTAAVAAVIGFVLLAGRSRVRGTRRPGN